MPDWTLIMHYLTDPTQRSYETSPIISPTLQVQKLRVGEMMSLSQGNKDGSGAQTQAFQPGPAGPEPDSLSLFCPQNVLFQKCFSHMPLTIRGQNSPQPLTIITSTFSSTMTPTPMLVTFVKYSFFFFAFALIPPP